LRQLASACQDINMSCAMPVGQLQRPGLSPVISQLAVVHQDHRVRSIQPLTLAGCHS
jgi:hypothetical protein